MKTIKLVYWQTTTDNYGDLLSPYLIHALSACEIVHKNYFVGNLNSHIYNAMQSILHFDWRFHCRYLFPFEDNIVGIGSILYAGNHRSKIWGAGFMGKDEKCIGGTVYALRGRYSLAIIQQLIQNGSPIRLNKKVVLGDPALLLPRVIAPSEKKIYKIGIIPHFTEVEYFLQNYGDRFHIIDLRSSDIESVTRDITSCEHILSTSLHGIIVAHAYGIPALWMELTGLESFTKGFKFRDYFSAVGVEEYNPIRNLQDILESEETALREFEVLSSHSLPTADINIICDDLIAAAPFKCTPL